MTAQVVKPQYGAATALTVTGFNALANGASVTSDAIDNSANLYLDYLVEILATVGTVSGDKAVQAWVQASVDGANYSDSTQEMNMFPLVLVSTPTNATAFRSRFASVAEACGGKVPPKFKIVIKNSTGAALAGAGNSAQYVGWNGQVV